MSTRSILLRLAPIAFALAAAILGTAPASAKPPGPINATQTERGTGCGVRDAEGNYHFDPNCEYMFVEHRDRDGSVQHFSYRDHGRLPATAPHPTTAQRITSPHPYCIGGYDERITPWRRIHL